jgi:hypothetical protein
VLAAVHWADAGVGAAVALAAALVAGLVFWRLQLGREKRTLVYRSLSSSIVEQRGPEPSVEVRYDGSPVPRVTRTRLVLWNPGWQTIEAQDVVERDPVRIVAQGGDILKANLLRETRRSVNWRLTRLIDGYRCEFVLLDRNDGVVVDLLHTARSADVVLMGTIKGMPEGIRNLGFYVTGDRLFATSLSSLMFGCAIFFGGILNTLVFAGIGKPLIPPLAVLFVAFAFGASGRSFTGTRRQPPRRLLTALVDEEPSSLPLASPSTNKPIEAERLRDR